MIIKKFTDGIEIWRQKWWEPVRVGDKLLTRWGAVIVDEIDELGEAIVSYDVEKMPKFRYQRPAR